MSLSHGQAEFQSTRWSLIRATTKHNDPQVQRALAELCEIYWLPLYSFARRQGAQVADAQEQVQEFFVELLNGSFFGKADEDKGKFRSFLLKSFSHFVTGWHRRQQAVKRGGKHLHFSIDIAFGEARYQNGPQQLKSPEQLFERQWALTLLDSAISHLQQEYEDSGKADLFQRLLPHLNQDAEARPYQDIAESLLLSETAVKVAAYRMRKRYRDILRAEISETIQGNERADVDEELRWLITILSS